MHPGASRSCSAAPKSSCARATCACRPRACEARPEAQGCAVIWWGVGTRHDPTVLRLVAESTPNAAPSEQPHAGPRAARRRRTCQCPSSAQPSITARAGNRLFGCQAPSAPIQKRHKTNLLWETPRTLNRRGRARTEARRRVALEDAARRLPAEAGRDLVDLPVHAGTRRKGLLSAPRIHTKTARR
jgi:hypothetical protein